MVIAEFRIGARPDQDAAGVRFGQHRREGLLQFLFEDFVEHSGKGPRTGLFLRRILLDNFVHGGGIGGLLKLLSKFLDVKKLGDIGQGVEMFLELALRHQEEHDQIDGLIIQRVKVDPGDRAAHRPDDFLDQIGRGMGDADSKADAGAHGRFALLDDGDDGVAVLGPDACVADQILDQLIDGIPAIG